MSAATEPTQCDIILARLQATPGEWVPMPELCRLSGSLNVHSRIDELRRDRGLLIENRQERVPNTRRRTSRYRLSAGEPETPDQPSVSAKRQG